MMEGIIKDEVIGELEFQDVAWVGELNTPILNSDGNLTLVVHDANKEGILDIQREAYKTYLQNEERYKSCVTELFLDYYKWNYEYIARTVCDLEECDRKDVVTGTAVLGMAPLWYLFIDRNGSYGYAFGCCWDVDNGLAVLLSEDEPRVISRTQIENLHKLNDPTLGLLVHDGKNAWKGLERNSFFGKLENLEIELEGGVEEGITPAQQKAYAQYLEKKSLYFDELTKMMLGVYVGSDEKAEAMLKTGQKIFVETVLPKTLFIDREGNYGWICYTVWDDSYIGVLLSDERLYVMTVPTLRNYSKKEKVKDDVLGLLIPSYLGFDGLVVVKLVDEILTLPLMIRTGEDQTFNEKMKKASNTYLKMKPTFWTDIKKKMLRYYLYDYERFEEFLEIPEELSKENVTEDSVMSIVTFKYLYMDFLGKIGWLCDSPTDEEDGLAFEFTSGETKLESQVDIL